MNKYYILNKEVENEVEDAMLSGENVYLFQFQEYFEEGKSLEINEIRVPLFFNAYLDNLRGRMTDNLYMEQFNCLVLSKRAKQLLSEKLRNLQFLPMIITDNYSNNEAVMMAKMQSSELDHKSITYDNYHIANVVGLIDCIDHKTSSLEYFSPRQETPEDLPENMKQALQQEEDNDIDFIRKLVLDETKIPEDIKIFRLKDCPRILVFKEEIVKAIREAKLTGFVFIPINKYTDQIPDDDDNEQEEETTAAKQPEKAPKAKDKGTSKPRRKIVFKNTKKRL